jgi:hypothetical protein
VHRHHALPRNRRPDAELAQEGDVARGEGVDPGIEAVADGRRRALLGKERYREAARCAGEATADRTAADDDEVDPGRVYNRVLIRGELAQLVRAAES